MTAHMRHSGTKVCPNGTPNASPSPAECNVLAEELAVLGNHGVEEAPPHVVVRCTASVGAADAALQVRVRLLQHLEDAAPLRRAASCIRCSFRFLAGYGANTTSASNAKRPLTVSTPNATSASRKSKCVQSVDRNSITALLRPTVMIDSPAVSWSCQATSFNWVTTFTTEVM
mmetsp:Transcript_23174/g.46949  ORF Transcript_23174/g.46949 Transcript_23174/m.46949 type:complete len:172 (+) Transcript_23174:142-657(+)